MRRPHATELPLLPIIGGHRHAEELRIISDLLDQNPRIAVLASEDLVADRSSTVGRDGLTGDQAVRMALLKQIHGVSYRALCFYLSDSATFQAFARLPFTRTMKPSTLQGNIKKLSAATWEEINRVLLEVARERGVERGAKIRVDCTTVEANVHPPTDSSLLWDCVRVVTRLLGRVAERQPEAHVPFTDHTRRAKRRAHAIAFPPRGKKREGHLRRAYDDLLKVSRRTYRAGRATETRLSEVLPCASLTSSANDLTRYLDAMEIVIRQTHRRVVKGETVPAAEKIVSIFEPHTAIVVKGRRDVVFGHKICLTGGASSLILDCFIEDANPADSTLVERTLERHAKNYGRVPRQATFDGGFASKANLQTAKKLGAQDVVFHKTAGLQVADMAKSEWVFRRLRRFRAGIEGCISTLKRAFNLDRCTWRSMESFRAYVWSCVVSFNAIFLARHLLR